MASAVQYSGIDFSLPCIHSSCVVDMIDLGIVAVLTHSAGKQEWQTLSSSLA